MSDFATIVRAELAAARAKHGPLNSAHEAYAVILEELDEFWGHCRLKAEDRSKTLVLRELAQVAAMAQRAAEDLGLVGPEFPHRGAGI